MDVKRTLGLIAALAAAGSVVAGEPAATKTDKRLIERGRYLVQVSGCNDCHTAGYMPAEGKVPEADWLTGAPVGFQGPWGTTYPANLRLAVSTMTEAEWVKRSRSAMRPPMPWFNLAAMTDGDLRALYAYIRHLGPKGGPVPPAAAPGEKVGTPYFEFVPKNLPPQAAGGGKG